MNDLFEYLREEMEERSIEEDFVAFRDWQDHELQAILGLGSRETCAAGEKLIQMGSAEDRDIYIVISGELEAFHVMADEEKRLAILKSGDLFGEISFVDGRPRSANVRALVDAVLLRIRPEDLDAFCEREPRVALRFMKEVSRILSARLRRLEAG
jgi:CRP-like cAMP-binding protein